MIAVVTTGTPVRPTGSVRVPSPQPSGETSSDLPAGIRWPERLTWVGIYLLAQAAFLLVLRLLSPRFFYIDDQQAQYLPMFHWFGRNLEGGRPPLLSPEQGSAGNLVADAQYGVYDPLHWLMSWAVGHAGNLNDAAWLLGGTAVFVLGLGVVTLLQSYRCPPALAVAAAVGLASTGFYLWIGTAWWPMLWSTAWLPWLWYGLTTRGRHGVLVTGLAAYVLATSGYPYNLVFAAVTVAAQLGERWLTGGLRGVLDRGTLARVVAGIGGALAALPGLLSSAQMLPFATRDFPEIASGNPGNFIPNLLDLLVGGATLNANVAGFWSGNITFAPLAATAAFAFPALALVAWKQVLRRPGVPTAAVLVLTAVLATQMPTFVGPFRQPWRYLADVGLYLPILVALGLTYSYVLTRRRLAVAGVLAAGQLVLALLRSPLQAPWHLLALLVTLTVLAALVGSRSLPRRPLRRACAGALVLTTLLAPILSERAATALNTRYEVLEGFRVTGEPSRDLLIREDWPSTLQEFREHAQIDGTDATVMTFATEDDDQGGWGTGIVDGNANLYADIQPGFGYVAVGSKAWSIRSCIGRYGVYYPAPDCSERLLVEVPGTGRPYLDLMAQGEVLLDDDTPAEIRTYFEQSWDAAGEVPPYTRFRRGDPLPGRITATRGSVQVGESPISAAPAYGGQALESYSVSTGAAGGDLVLRIPFWPGLEATVGGRAVEVTDIGGVLSRIALPGGLTDTPVSVEFRPRGEALLVPLLTVGGLLVLLATAAAAPLRLPGARRRRDAQASSGT